MNERKERKLEKRKEKMIRGTFKSFKRLKHIIFIVS